MTDIVSKYNLFQPSRVAGISVLLEGEAIKNFDLVIISYEKGDINVSSCKLNIGTFEDLVKILPKSIPVILVPEGNPVIHKIKDDDTVNLKHIIPGIDLTEIYYQKTKNDSHQIVSLFKKNILTTLHELFEKAGFFIYGCYFSPFLIQLFSNMFSQERMVTKYSVFSFRGQDLIDVSTNSAGSPDQPVPFPGVELNSETLIPFLAAVSLYKGDIEIEPFSQTGKIEFINRMIYTRLLHSAGIATFIVLLVNFLLFLSFSSSLSEIDSGLNASDVKIDEIRFLEQKIREKQELVDQRGSWGMTLYSYYFDRIAITMNQHIKLTEMEAEPLMDRIRTGRSIQVSNNTILIRGKVNNIHNLHHWFKKLQEEPWIKNISIEEFQLGEDEKNFLLKIHYL